MSNPIFTTYSPDKVIITFNGVIINGFADGTFIELERNEHVFSEKAGSLGDIVRTKNKNRSGKATITLLAQVPVNDLLQALVIEDEENDDPLNVDAIGPFLVKDLSGNTLCESHVAWISHQPKFERAKESGHVVWQFAFANLKISVAGNLKLL